ncbi:signal peptide peptidase SppA [Pasteurellaceae bacterium RH1A]|nr:signal peptide peptidase SppA [Pasteurellaceae bacterium RH1A]
MLEALKVLCKILRCIREGVMSLFFILFVMFCFSLASLFGSDEGGASKRPAGFSQGALLLNLDGYLADNHDEFGDFRRLLKSELGDDEPAKISTFDVVQALAQAKYDDQITGLVLDLSRFKGGDLASLTFLGKEIQDFKKANKPVIAIGEAYSQAQYYLASFADQILLNPAGFVELEGLNYSTLYFKSLLDKIEAVPHIFRVGTYKSAVEPFIRDDMSAEARKNTSLWVNQLWANMKEQIAQNRQLKPEDLVPAPARYLELFKAAQGDTAQYALKQGLVSRLAGYQAMRQSLIEQFGEDDEGEFKHIDFNDYSSQLSDRFKVRAPHKIAIINVEGAIIWGESDEGSAGSDTVISLLRQAREDETVRGVILRINSPGGSAMASELIRQEVDELQAAGKPVVASMGGTAASGGYWIAATSDKIIASPNTITGSIGIFGLMVTFEKTAKNLGIHQDGVATSPLAGTSVLKSLNKEQGQIIQVSIEEGYDRFLNLVSRGRNMSKAEVDKVAQGQVWTGQQAFELGLVDKLGDFDLAYQELKDLINQARKTQGQPDIEQFRPQWFVEQDDSLFGGLMRGLKPSIQLSLANLLDLPLAQALDKQTQTLKQFNDPKQTYLYCLNCGRME